MISKGAGVCQKVVVVVDGLPPIDEEDDVGREGSRAFWAKDLYSVFRTYYFPNVLAHA